MSTVYHFHYILILCAIYSARVIILVAWQQTWSLVADVLHQADFPVSPSVAFSLPGPTPPGCPHLPTQSLRHLRACPVGPPHLVLRPRARSCSRRSIFMGTIPNAPSPTNPRRYRLRVSQHTSGPTTTKGQLHLTCSTWTLMWETTMMSSSAPLPQQPRWVNLWPTTTLLYHNLDSLALFYFIFTLFTHV